MPVRAFIAAVLVATSPACAAADKDADAFAAEMRGRLAAQIAGATVAPDPDDALSAKVEGGEREEATVNFHRIFNYCQTASAEDCAASKQEFVEKISRKPSAITKESLRLIVRDAQYLNYIRSTEKGIKLAYTEKIGEDLFAILASDSPDTIALVGDQGLKDVAMTRDQAWSVAAAQTRSILPPIPTAAQLKTDPMAYQEFELLGSLLIDLPAWEKLSEEVGPDLFVTVVSDDFVFVATMPDSPELDAFKRTVADDCQSQQRCISPNLYRFRNGQWVVSR